MATLQAAVKWCSFFVEVPKLPQHSAWLWNTYPEILITLAVIIYLTLLPRIVTIPYLVEHIESHIIAKLYNFRWNNKSNGLFEILLHETSTIAQSFFPWTLQVGEWKNRYGLCMRKCRPLPGRVLLTVSCGLNFSYLCCCFEITTSTQHKIFKHFWQRHFRICHVLNIVRQIAVKWPRVCIWCLQRVYWQVICVKNKHGIAQLVLTVIPIFRVCHFPLGFPTHRCGSSRVVQFKKVPKSVGGQRRFRRDFHQVAGCGRWQLRHQTCRGS